MRRQLTFCPARRASTRPLDRCPIPSSLSPAYSPAWRHATGRPPNNPTAEANEPMPDLDLPANAPEAVFTAKETATILKVSTRTVRRLIKEKTLAVVRVGRPVRVRAKSLADQNG